MKAWLLKPSDRSFILHPSSFIPRIGGSRGSRTHRGLTPATLAESCHTVRRGFRRKVRESNPPERYLSRFSGPLGLPRAEPSVCFATGAQGLEP